MKIPRDEFGDVAMWVLILAVFGAVLAVFAGLTVVAVTGANHDSHVQCLRISEQTGMFTKTVGVMDVTCFILVPGVGWVRSDLYRGVVVPV